MASYSNPYQWNDQVVEWDPNAPRQSPWGETFQVVNPGYISGLLSLRDRVQSGQASPEERQEYAAQEAAARAIPMRDPASLQFGWSNAEVGSWDEGGSDWWNLINGSSPDLGPVLLTIRDRMDRGQATPQERQLYEQTLAYDTDWTLRASLPQASDVGFGLGDNLTGALMVLGLGATGGLAAAPLVAGGAGLATTLGSLGTLSGIAGTGAGILGGATGHEWLSKAGLGLGALGGVLGGLGGLSSLWGTGVQSLSDAAKLASSAGKITGAIGSASGNDALRQASRYLGQAGQLGQFGAGVLPSSLTDWSGDNAPWAANVAPGVSNLLSAADVATQRGGGGMETDWGSTDWLDWSGGGQGPLLRDAAPDIDWSSFTAGGPGSWAGQVMTDWADSGGGGGGLLSTLGGLAGAAGKFLGSNASWLGPAASALGGLGAGALGANASSDAAALQAAALNRALDLQTAQWLTQQQNQAPWLQAGQQALPQLQQLASQAQPTFQQPGLPGTQPFQYRGPGMPGQGFQYTGAGMPDTGFQYTNQMPTQDFQAPTFEALKARDPGIQARLDEARNALEASALARGTGMSGAMLAALQQQSQDLASREYAPAYQRALGEYQQEYGQDWQRQQEAYQRALGQNQQLYGRQYQQQGDLYGRQLAENQLGYGRGMEQYRQGYGEQAALNQQDYARNQALYQQQYQQMMDQYNAQRQGQNTAWNQYAALAGLGQTAVGQLGTAGQNNATQMAALLSQLGNAQGLGELGPALAWQKGIGGATNNLTSLLAGLNR